MYTVDKSGYKNVLLNFHEQIANAQEVLDKSKVEISSNGIENILYLGIGASGLAGQLLKDVLFSDLTMPMDVVGSYFSPAFCNEKTLVIASSYSGDTEETLAATEQAAATGAKVICVASGGQLEKLAKEKNLPLVKLPENFLSRQALGYLFFTVYHLLGRGGFFNNYNEDLSELIKFVKEIGHRNDYPNYNGHVLSRELAYNLENKIPVIYSTAPFLRSVSQSWKNEIEQKAKALAFAGVIPEMNHNEIVGWEWQSKVINDFVVIFLENEDVHPRILKRIELTKKIIKGRGVEVVDIYADGKTVLEKVFSLVLLGDWTSYYLALLYKKDPIEIEHVDFLKKEMATM